METIKVLQFGDGSNLLSMQINIRNEAVFFIEPGQGVHEVGEYEDEAVIYKAQILPTEITDMPIALRFSNVESLNVVIDELIVLRELYKKRLQGV